MKQHETADRTAAPGPGDYSPETFLIQGRLARIRGQDVLFSSSRQAIFAVNDTAGDIWRSLEEGMPPEAISFEIARGGVDRREANRHVEAALIDWERLGLIRPCAPLSQPSVHEHVSQVIAVAGLYVRIVYPAAYAFPAITVFRHIEVRRKAVDVVLQLVEHGGRIHLFRDCDWVLSCSPDELPVILKGQLHDLLKEGDYWRGRIDLRHLHDLAQLAESDDVDWTALQASVSNQSDRNALYTQLLALHHFFGIKIPRKCWQRPMVRFEHRRRIFTAKHPIIGAPLRLAGNLVWGIWRFSHADGLARRGPFDLARRIARTLLSPGTKI